MERFSLISPEPHMPDTDLRLRKLMEIEEAIEAYVRDNDVSRLNQLLSDPEYESLFLKRLRLTNRHEIWNIIHLPPEERKIGCSPIGSWDSIATGNSWSLSLVSEWSMPITEKPKSILRMKILRFRRMSYAS